MFSISHNNVVRFSSSLFSISAMIFSSAGSSAEMPIHDQIGNDKSAPANQVDVGRDIEMDTITITSDGMKREALIQAPNQSVGIRPTIIFLHGGTRRASDVKWTSWPQIAKRERLLLVAPQGVDRQWNDGRNFTISGTRSTANDVDFLSNLIKTLISEHGADPRAIFITGVSNGGLMSIRIGCERPSLLAAIAPVIATMPEAIAPMCRTAAPLPALFIAGTADPLMTYNGKPSAFLLGRGNSAPMLSMPATLELWRLRNGCADSGITKNLPDISKTDQSTVTRVEYRPCGSGAQLLHYRVNGGGHAMPSMEFEQLRSRVARISAQNKGTDQLRGRLAQLGPLNKDIDGPEAIWQFFSMQIKK